MRRCRKCGCKIEEKDLGNRFKAVGREKSREWILRHIKQTFSLMIHGFVKPEIEGYIELCDKCFKNLLAWLEDTKED